MSLNRDALNAAIEDDTVAKPSAERVETFNEAGVPCGPIYSIDEVFADPQVRHLEMAQPVEHPKLGPIEMVGQAVTLSRAPNRIRSATPEAGQHTEEILRELGLDDGEVARLRSKRIV